ncbi:helix-turn-helix domain-containing protein [Paenibacillus phytorum]|nr:AraC family transcriptional regulator [Paenibacillus phytorum]
MRSFLKIPHFEMNRCMAGTVIYPISGKYGPRLYNEIQLVLLHSGSMEVDIDGNLFKVSMGHVLLILPGQTVSIQFSKLSESWHRWVTITPMINIMEIVPELYQLPLVCTLSSSLNQLIDLMLNYQSFATTDYDSFHILGLAAIQIYADDCQNRSSAIKNPEILTVKSYIGDHLNQKINLEKLAQIANISPSHLIRLFRENEGSSPIQYLWTIRIERGLELLRTTGLSIGEIASQCGFSTLFHFSRLVKRKTGKTPTEVRALQWSGQY